MTICPGYLAAIICALARARRHASVCGVSPGKGVSSTSGDTVKKELLDLERSSFLYGELEARIRGWITVVSVGLKLTIQG